MEMNLDLGFMETAPSWKLSSRFFHSKVGGRPPWLALKDIPRDVICGSCLNPLTFLLQIYAPIEEDPLCFHRSIFVFLCRSPSCHTKDDFTACFKVYRSQLPRINEYYPSDPPVERKEWRPDLIQENFLTLCRICGIFSSKLCSNCKEVRYCSKMHQALDWKKGEHKNECRGGEASRKTKLSQISSFSSSFLLPEFELVMEADDEIISDVSDDDDDNEAVNVETELEKAAELDNKELSAEEVTKAIKPQKRDICFETFCKNVKVAPDQVVRYSRTRDPLWISKDGIPKSEDVPKCEYCGSNRKFEFQIMPQILTSLKLGEESLDGDSSVDWGILIVYTCSSSCSSPDPLYKKEYLFRQNVPKS